MSESTSPKILVIDDDPAILAMVEGALETEGYGLELIQNPLDAFRKDKPSDYDLIVTDYDMKPLKGDALTFLAQISEEDGDCTTKSMPPVIIMTGYRDHARVAEWAKWDMVKKALEKPFNLDELREAVRAALQAR